MTNMKSAVFVEAGRIVLDEKPIPDMMPAPFWLARST